MSIRELTYTIKGIAPLLMANPQTVDRFNPIARAMAAINAKGKRRTDDDYMEMRDLEMRAKIYWDDDLGIYVPTTWMTSALCKISFTQAKISKDNIRGGVFATTQKIALNYKGKRAIKGAEDIVKNGDFRHIMLLKQGQVKIAKTAPIFHEWSFTGGLEYDDKVIDPDTLKHLINHAAHYGGFGDFRPTFGRAEAEVEYVS